MRNSPNISGRGANKFEVGFSEENLNSHWEKHSKEYAGYNKEQYAQEALCLVQPATSDTIIGYKNARGQVVRYDTESENFVKGHPDLGIVTMFKPEDKIEYIYEWAGEEAMED